MHYILKGDRHAPSVHFNEKRRQAGCGMQGMLAGIGGGISVDNRVRRWAICMLLFSSEDFRFNSKSSLWLYLEIIANLFNSWWAITKLLLCLLWAENKVSWLVLIVSKVKVGRWWTTSAEEPIPPLRRSHSSSTKGKWSAIMDTFWWWDNSGHHWNLLSTFQFFQMRICK